MSLSKEELKIYVDESQLKEGVTTITGDSQLQNLCGVFVYLDGYKGLGQKGTVLYVSRRPDNDKVDELIKKYKDFTVFYQPNLQESQGKYIIKDELYDQVAQEIIEMVGGLKDLPIFNSPDELIEGETIVKDFRQLQNIYGVYVYLDGSGERPLSGKVMYVSRHPEDKRIEEARKNSKELGCYYFPESKRVLRIKYGK